MVHAARAGEEAAKSTCERLGWACRGGRLVRIPLCQGASVSSPTLDLPAYPALCSPSSATCPSSPVLSALSASCLTCVRSQSPCTSAHPRVHADTRPDNPLVHPHRRLQHHRDSAQPRFARRRPSDLPRLRRCSQCRSSLALPRTPASNLYLGRHRRSHDARRAQYHHRHVVRRRAPFFRRFHVRRRLLAVGRLNSRQHLLQHHPRSRPRSHKGL